MAMGKRTKAWATAVIAAGLIAIIAFGGSAGAWSSVKGDSGGPGGVTASSRFAEDVFDPDPPANWRRAPDTIPAAVAIDAVANYCTPTPCRPR